jgi:hypothetical protein
MASMNGVYPVYENQFKIGKSKDAATSIAEMENFSVSFSNTTQNWTPMDQNGWQSALTTGKAVTITISGKRSVGDTGNDFIADKAFKSGQNCYAYFEWVFPDGTTVSWDKAVIDVKNIGGGGSTDVGPLEFDVISNGEPTVTSASTTSSK